MTTARAIFASIVGLILLALLSMCGLPQQRPSLQVHWIGAAAAPPAVQVTVYSAPWCGPCHVYIGGTKEHTSGIRDTMPPDGWVIRNAGERDASLAHIIIQEVTDPAEIRRLKLTGFPTTVIRKNGREVKRFTGRKSGDDLANLINEVAK